MRSRHENGYGGTTTDNLEKALAARGTLKIEEPAKGKLPKFVPAQANRWEHGIGEGACFVATCAMGEGARGASKIAL